MMGKKQMLPNDIQCQNNTVVIKLYRDNLSVVHSLLTRMTFVMCQLPNWHTSTMLLDVFEPLCLGTQLQVVFIAGL